MANTNNNNPRQTHVSPGVYTNEVELIYASKSLGITTLGVAGETVKGPAFQPITIENWRQYQTFFGGTSTEKYRGSQYPKYELPYIAQSYLKQSNQLEVVRVLGLSGVNAGPAWVITAKGKEGSKYDNMVVAVLRSRGEHVKAKLLKQKGEIDPETGEKLCADKYDFDSIKYYADNLYLTTSNTLGYNIDCSATPKDNEDGSMTVSSNNYGRFTVNVNNGDKKYSVSLNPNEKNYIINVFGTNPEVGDTEVYVEELYDVALRQLIDRGEIVEINSSVVFYDYQYIVPKFAPVDGFVTKEQSLLRRSDVGKRFLFNEKSKIDGLKVYNYNKDTNAWGENAEDGYVGQIYTVTPFTNPNGTREYRYRAMYKNDGGSAKYDDRLSELADTDTNNDTHIFENTVKMLDGETYYVLKGSGSDANIASIDFDMNNYKEQYRYSSTPWFVSEFRGSANDVDLTKLFRFHTISDGNSSSTEVKVSIENIDLDAKTFNVIVRDFYDTDANIVVYERFNGVNLIPGDANYIAKRIGSYDGEYEAVSNFITVEVNETERVKHSSPCGFLGYPVRDYNGQKVHSAKYWTTSGSEGEVAGENSVIKPYFQFNTDVDDDVRITRQYFGVSNITGIDEDILRYKGVEAYNGKIDGLTPGFHLDSRIITVDERAADSSLNQTVLVDGEEYNKWYTVGANNVTMMNINPMLGNEKDTEGTIYEDKRYRKFTVAFYGGWDGWDFYRTSRGNTDDFKYTKYLGKINKDSGEGVMVSELPNAEAYGFNSDDKILNSDYYAYMSAYRLFANPKEIDINVFATPGIDYVNQNSLVGDVIDMIETERADSVYVVTTPDKPYGASDSEMDMYTPSDAVMNLEDSEIDSNYTCSYYPWVKYFDDANNKYIYLPPTRDVVRNFAYTDNTKYPWFVSAGWYRGEIEDKGVRPKKSLKLEEQDTLYAGRLNFINTFAKEGMRVWGDKNMQSYESQMDRISKRRLLLRIRKLCSIACIGLLFDPNDNTTRQSFESAVSKPLNDIMANRGISDWRLEIDDSQEARDRLELPAKIFLRLTPNLEYISITFTITPSGANWDDI